MRSCICITAFVVHLSLAQANSTSNTTTTTNSTQLVGYVQDPNGRGTISLLLSCVLTLILCVWSALHLNVPAPDQTKVNDIWLNTRWIITVTLLEVNTVAHVLCAFAMYAFWWHKPLLPNQPIIIRDRDLQSLAAFMYSSSEMSGYVNPKRIRSQTVVKTALAGLNLFSKAPELETLCFRTPHLPTSGFDPAATVDRAPPSCVDQLDAQRQKETGTAFFERRPRVVDRRPTDDFVTGADQRRWALVKDALIRYSVLTEHKSYLALAHEVDGESCLHLRPDHLVASYIKNWPSNDLLRSVDGLIVGMVLWLANFCYGGIHAAAWNDHFPSEPEKWLWRASASYIGFCGGLWVVLNLLVAKYQRLNDFWEHWMDGKKSWWQSFALGTVVGVCGVSLFLARFYIVLEAFVSIRRMPLAAYQTPEWTDILPHF